MDTNIVDGLKKIVGGKNVCGTRGNNKKYLCDQTTPYLRPEASKECVIVFPENTFEVSEIMKLANENKVNVIARGGGTGLCGAAIPTIPSIIISMEKFDKIIEIDEKNFTMTVESGVTLKEMITYLKKQGNQFCIAEYTCNENAQIGGMVAENAGGLKGWRRGTMRNNVRGLEVVLPTGEIEKLNGKIRKNNAGYDLMQLIIGSEGTLGIITKVMLSISHSMGYNGIILASFHDYYGAVEATTKVMQAGVHPNGIEYMDRSIVLETCKYLECEWPLKKGKVDLLFIMEEDDEEILFNSSEIIEGICRMTGCVECEILDGESEYGKIINIRKETYNATKHLLVDTLDITVPPAYILDFMKEFSKIAERYGAKTNTVGHIGDGNLHNNIYSERRKIPEFYEKMREEAYRLGLSYEGTITGEHGIGKIRRDELKMQLDERQVRIMRGIKAVFDPNHILNIDNGIV